VAELLLEGDTAGALSRLRDRVHVQITFKELARQTGLGEKTLHRMLNRNGNPTARIPALMTPRVKQETDIILLPSAFCLLPLLPPRFAPGRSAGAF
jgi:hypothetical protein